MPGFNLRKYLLITFSGLLIVTCSQLGIQTEKETTGPSLIPDCKKNYTKEGFWPFDRVYKTWVGYDPFDYKKGFDATIKAIKALGHRVTSSDLKSGTINAEMVLGIEEQKKHLVNIKLNKEKTALIIYLSSKSASGTSGQEAFCAFFNECDKLIKRKTVSLESKPPVVSTQKESLPPSPTPGETSKPSRQPPPPPKTSSLKTQVIWTWANLREGPGENYKIVGKVNKGTSLTILEDKKDWLRVRLSVGTEAWIFKEATSKGTKPSIPSPKPTNSSEPKSPL